MAAMRICLMLEGQEGITWPQWLELAQATEAAGLEGLFRSDHYRSIVRGEPAGSLDAWTTLAALAARTERIRLGTMVSPVTFRPVSVLAKSVVTVDHVSGGRVELGIGAGWYEAEHETYGLPFLTVRERLDLLDRQLAEIHRQWEEAPDVEPKPLQRPHPPIIVGGRARPRTVRAAARFADEYNVVFPSVDDLHAARAALDEAALGAGREPATLSFMTACAVGRDEREAQERVAAYKRIVGGGQPPPLAGTVREVAAELRRFEAAGARRAMLQHIPHEDVDMVAVLGELAAEVA
jgi:alkanesulfonate monooxygenase SsuD/methylene tetrahydromethanopterin reductase-like flavin-dependent oxidoreductase (luciferase family)